MIFISIFVLISLIDLMLIAVKCNLVSYNSMELDCLMDFL